MKVYQVKISPLADGDLLNIWDFISQENPLAAERLLERIGDRIDSLTRFPERGKPMTHIVSAARCLIESRYLIFYTAHPDMVRIERILSGSRLLSSDYFGI